jgi:hypothetical protein
VRVAPPIKSTKLWQAESTTQFLQANFIEAAVMLETKEKERDTLRTHPRPEFHDKTDAAGQAGDQSRPEIIIVIGLVAVISMAFGFILGLLF